MMREVNPWDSNSPFSMTDKRPGRYVAAGFVGLVMGLVVGLPVRLPVGLAEGAESSPTVNYKHDVRLVPTCDEQEHYLVMASAEVPVLTTFPGSLTLPPLASTIPFALFG